MHEEVEMDTCMGSIQRCRAFGHGGKIRGLLKIFNINTFVTPNWVDRVRGEIMNKVSITINQMQKRPIIISKSE